MDQSQKRRLNHRKTGLSQCKVARTEEPEDVCESRDVLDAAGSDRHFSTIRASSPQSDSASNTPLKHSEPLTRFYVHL